MRAPRSALQNRLLQYAAELRYPKLLALTLAVFVADLIFPDAIPFVDEILLGLVSLVLATWRQRKPRATVREQPNTNKSS
jgi:hypothetical protein